MLNLIEFNQIKRVINLGNSSYHLNLLLNRRASKCRHSKTYPNYIFKNSHPKWLFRPKLNLKPVMPNITPFLSASHLCFALPEQCGAHAFPRNRGRGLGRKIYSYNFTKLPLTPNVNGRCMSTHAQVSSSPQSRAELTPEQTRGKIPLYNFHPSIHGL